MGDFGRTWSELGHLRPPTLWTRLPDIVSEASPERVRTRTQLWPSSRPMLGEFGPKLGPMLAKSGLESSVFFAISANIGACTTPCSRCRPDVGQTRPGFDQMWAILAEFGPSSASILQFPELSNIARPEHGLKGPNTHFGVDFPQPGETLDKLSEAFFLPNLDPRRRSKRGPKTAQTCSATRPGDSLSLV